MFDVASSENVKATINRSIQRHYEQVLPHLPDGAMDFHHVDRDSFLAKPIRTCYC